MRHLTPRLSLLAVSATLLGACAGPIVIPPPPAGSVAVASGPWRVNGALQPARITNGPWTLAQSSATLAQPLAGYCASGTLTSNTATNLMQPYYFPFVTGTGLNLDGYFDYRVKDQDEAVVHASSTDGGLTWTSDATTLRLNAGVCPATTGGVATAIGNDNGQGHPTVLKVQTSAGVRTLLYTVDRVSSVVDAGGLLVHNVSSGASSLPASEPVSMTTPVPAGVSQTSGLQNPDGILGSVPGTGTDVVSNPLKVIYLKKIKGTATAPAAGLNTAALCTDSQSLALTGKKANYDSTQLRLASTTDGVTFTDLGALSGLNNPDDSSVSGFRFVGPRGTVLRYADGSYGLFFSGGNCQDGDSDAYHFIGYAHSSDAVNWTVDQGTSNPLVQVDYSYPSALPAAYSSGRVYDPSVTVNTDGTLRLIFSGYRTGSPLPKTGSASAIGTAPTTFQPTDAANYRTLLVINLKH